MLGRRRRRASCDGSQSWKPSTVTNSVPRRAAWSTDPRLRGVRAVGMPAQPGRPPPDSPGSTQLIMDRWEVVQEWDRVLCSEIALVNKPAHITGRLHEQASAVSVVLNDHCQCII